MASDSLSILAAYWRLLRENRNYRRLWMAQVVSETGDWFYSIAIYSLLLELTGKASSVALALVLQVLPQTFTNPIAGVVNDRLSRKQVMIAADLARMVIVVSMLLVRTRSMVWLVYPLLFLETVAWAFFEPARTSVIPNIAGHEQLTTANTLSSTTWSFNLAIGSALGGIVGLLLGRNWVFILDGGSFLLSALLLAGIRIHEPHMTNAGPLRARELADFKPVLEGARYIAADGRRLVTVFAKAGTAILGTSWVLFPVMGVRTFPMTAASGSRGMLALSLLMTARGVGALLGPLFTAGWVQQDEGRLRRAILLGYMLAGVGYLALSCAPELALACLAVIVAHMGGSNVWVHSTTLLQLRTDDEYRGRVFSAELGLAMAGLAAVAASSGYLIDHGATVRQVAAGTGTVMFVPALLWTISGRAWRVTASSAPETDARS